MDFARSSDPAVQRQLDRLAALSPGRDILGLERITALLGRLRNPERRLPPVLHVAGTNGKGSTCAFLRAAIEAAGLVTHVYTSPHLVRFNERIRVAGKLIGDAALAGLLEEALDAAGDLGASFFEVTTAAAFLAFARTPADACIIEVGLGGRLDATNVIPKPAACGIAALGIDHQAFLGDRLGQIAGEKAGIARAGVPLVTLAYPQAAEESIEAVVAATGAVRLKQGEAWSVEDGTYRDRFGAVALPAPALPGAHQWLNAGLAVAMLRHQDAITVPDRALAAGVRDARWPARLQRLARGPLVGEREVWLDGGHNESAGEALAEALRDRPEPHLILGMLANKDAGAFLRLLAPVVRSVSAVPVANHEHHAPEDLVRLAHALGLEARACTDISCALEALGEPVLIAGSLYLAGTVLALNGEAPQ
ncbi:bifunctional folylpolyglutamate synthase/dihydrofolate synthase [Sphingomonas sp. MAH-20]|uniref:tetrahydrofolate synthase n=1 Tax=Sphingomonas horti TaxID=2682842 RepID=A0A6I4J1U3_9SPHN|nr:folylpolyglutamate synthase/dihydrofolate synthase family protein [Sphingomonas sp. CGMCC 1.13658]MBA2919373.1 bifunctional folylpolyglutamate synthase/dihydrofolate synthase [Sphingomonas sp. CGMCC 1.13658]MVO78254.1 bifunctional folylpolyglutamate synthase/dihydrofolate synthase [Sphingomonas horti]